MPTQLNRREFLAGTAVAVAAPTVFSLPARAAPSKRITVGLIGCGGMGNANMRGFLGHDDVQLVAVCDPDRGRRLTSKDVVERHYAAATRSGTYRGCVDYNDFRDLLARDDIDAVIVGSPDHWHALHVTHAARAGKDVYGEKPLSLTVAEGRAMSDAVARYGRVFQTGSQQRSDARFRHAVTLVRNGRIGRIRTITCTLPAGATTGNHPARPIPAGFDYDLWLGPAPWAPYCDSRTHYVFRHILDYSGGKLTDWGAHHIDIAQWSLGRQESGPVKISGTGEFPEDGLWNAPVRYEVRAEYDDGVELKVRSHPQQTGVEIVGDEGRIFVKRGRIETDPTRLVDETFSPSEIQLPPSDNHHRNFLDCVRSRRTPVAPIEHAHRTITIAHLGNIAMRLGREIRWDPATETIAGDDTATRMLSRGMRAPWRL